MTQLEKLVERIKARPPEADFEDVESLLEAYGWEKKRQSGSHVAYKKGKGDGTITFPLVGGRRVKRVYLDRIIEKLGM